MGREWCWNSSDSGTGTMHCWSQEMMVNVTWKKECHSCALGVQAMNTFPLVPLPLSWALREGTSVWGCICVGLHLCGVTNAPARLSAAPMLHSTTGSQGLPLAHSGKSSLEGCLSSSWVTTGKGQGEFTHWTRNDPLGSLRGKIQETIDLIPYLMR